jgi:hypothetical protein
MGTVRGVLAGSYRNNNHCVCSWVITAKPCEKQTFSTLTPFLASKLMCDSCIDCQDVVDPETGKVKLNTVARSVMVEDASKKKKFYKLSLLIFDVPVLILGCVLLVAGVTLSLALFFALRQREQGTIFRALKDQSLIT